VGPRQQHLIAVQDDDNGSVRRTWVAVASVCIAILLTAGSCARNPSAPSGPDVRSGGTPPPQASEQLPLPKQLDFNGERIGGGTISGSDFAGQDVVLWLWAPW